MGVHVMKSLADNPLGTRDLVPMVQTAAGIGDVAAGYPERESPSGLSAPGTEMVKRGHGGCHVDL